jgi:hypothetical protein
MYVKQVWSLFIGELVDKISSAFELRNSGVLARQVIPAAYPGS